MRVIASLLAFGFAVFVARSSAADDARDDVTDVTKADPYRTFRYARPAEPDLFRALFEGVGVLSLGYVEYLAATHQVSPGGRLFFDGGIFYDKVSGNSQSFDGNQFGTNFIGHPFGGTLYYLAARSNRLSIPQSFAWAFTGSLLWEYFGEIREKPSVNDMITTPWGGFANAEAFTQLAAFFARGRKTVHGQALEILFGMPKTVHESIDGLVPEQAPTTDALGFPDDIWHDFRATASVGSTFQSGVGRPGSAGLDTGLSIDIELKNLAGLGRPGNHSRLYDDGNVASLHARFVQSEGRLVDGVYEAKLSPVGYYAQRAALDERGRLRGQSTIVGLTVGYEYGVHDYDRDRRRPVDVIGKVTVLGALAEHVAYLPGARLRARLEVGGDFAGVRAYALPAFLERYPIAPPTGTTAETGASVDLPYVLRSERYYFALGGALAPTLALELPAFELVGRVKWDEYHGILGLDVDQTKLTRDVRRSDRRVTASLRAMFRPVRALELGAEISGRRREGEVGDVRDARSERTLLALVGARF